MVGIACPESIRKHHQEENDTEQLKGPVDVSCCPSDSNDVQGQGAQPPTVGEGIQVFQSVGL